MLQLVHPPHVVKTRVSHVPYLSGIVVRYTSNSATSSTFDPLEWNKTQQPLASLTDQQIMSLIDARKVPLHSLEFELDAIRAVTIRRAHVTRALVSDRISKEGDDALAHLPVKDFNASGFYGSVLGTNCESVIGYVPVPVGVVGPLVIDNKYIRVPMATTEGALVASTNRGCRAIELSGGAATAIMANGMTRSPLLRAPSMLRAAQCKHWAETPENTQALVAAFQSTTRFGKLKNVKVYVAGRNLFVRFSCFTGDAMGMNMVTKGTMAALEVLTKEFPDLDLVSLSGNVCADKKAAAINWIEGRGRSVAAEVVLKKAVIEKTLKTTALRMATVNRDKNLVGSAVAGSIGGFNAHAANIVAAIYLATGNDIAQVVESSSCITLMEEQQGDLHVSVTMPSVEVGTVGGGTTLAAQHACLQVIGCAGSNSMTAGKNADLLARSVCGSVLAGEISLIAALTSGDLMRAHEALNRKKDGAGGHTRGYCTVARM